MLHLNQNPKKQPDAVNYKKTNPLAITKPRIGGNYLTRELAYDDCKLQIKERVHKKSPARFNMHFTIVRGSSFEEVSPCEGTLSSHKPASIAKGRIRLEVLIFKGTLRWPVAEFFRPFRERYFCSWSD